MAGFCRVKKVYLSQGGAVKGAMGRQLTFSMGNSIIRSIYTILIKIKNAVWSPGQHRHKRGKTDMFSTEHFIWIGLCAAFVAGMLIFCIRKKVSLKVAGYVMSGICLCSESSKILSNMVESPQGGMYLDPAALPFHLCSLMLFGVLYITFGKEGRCKQRLIDFVAVMGTLGSICAILIPTNGTDFTTVLAYQCFVYHGGLLWFSLYLILSGRAKLGLKAMGSNIGMLLLLAVAVLYVNGALSAYGTNFMYLVRPPMEDLPYLNLEQGWYVYFLRLLLLGLGLVSLFHIPFILHQKNTGSRNTAC